MSKTSASAKPFTRGCLDAAGGGSELCIVLPDHDSVNRPFEEWKGLGVKFVQPPAKAVFGLTFVARDPEGHRLRAVAGEPSGEQGSEVRILYWPDRGNS